MAPLNLKVRQLADELIAKQHLNETILSSLPEPLADTELSTENLLDVTAHIDQVRIRLSKQLKLSYNIHDHEVFLDLVFSPEGILNSKLLSSIMEIRFLIMLAQNVLHQPLDRNKRATLR